MSKGIDRIRKSIMRRQKLRKQNIETKIDKNYLTQTMLDEEEKHGYFPTSFERLGEPGKKHDSKGINFHAIGMKAIVAIILFISTHFLLTSNKISTQRAKQVTENLLTEEFPFARVYIWYQNTLGTPLAFTSTNSDQSSPDAKSDDHHALPVNGTVTTHFNDHDKGIFIEPDRQTHVRAWREGVVVFAGNDRKTNKTVIIQHEDQSKTTYGNLASMDVHLYQFVSHEDVIGKTHEDEMEEAFYFSLQKKNEYIDPFQVIKVDDIP